jgi:hypothetical protein
MLSRIDKRTAAATAAVLLGLFALAAWGDHLHMNPDVLTGIRTAAAAVGSAILAAMPALFKDSNGNGTPDGLE